MHITGLAHETIVFAQLAARLIERDAQGRVADCHVVGFGSSDVGSSPERGVVGSLRRDALLRERLELRLAVRQLLAMSLGLLPQQQLLGGIEPCGTRHRDRGERTDLQRNVSPLERPATGFRGGQRIVEQPAQVGDHRGQPVDG